jgi:hypothetical protein
MPIIQPDITGKMVLLPNGLFDEALEYLMLAHRRGKNAPGREERPSSPFHIA